VNEAYSREKAVHQNVEDKKGLLSKFQVGTNLYCMTFLYFTMLVVLSRAPAHQHCRHRENLSSGDGRHPTIPLITCSARIPLADNLFDS
jgi:hypothetical protein